MECANFSAYIDNINGYCGNDINEVVRQCEVECLMIIIDCLNSCLEDLTKIRFDRQLENIINYCYISNH